MNTTLRAAEFNFTPPPKPKDPEKTTPEQQAEIRALRAPRAYGGRVAWYKAMAKRYNIGVSTFTRIWRTANE